MLSKISTDYDKGKKASRDGGGITESLKGEGIPRMNGTHPFEQHGN
jgi:hypothetical protein